MRATLKLLLPALLLQGCLHAISLDPISRDLEEQLDGATLDPEVRLTLGRFTLGLARTMCGLLPAQDAHQARAFLSHLRRVELAVYQLHGQQPLGRLQMPRPLRDKLAEADWSLAVQVRDPDERVWILTRESRGRIQELLVATLGTDELVLVRVSGNLQGLVAQALRPESKVFGKSRATS